jgi:predicted site-specific integrase-resolvase
LREYAAAQGYQVLKEVSEIGSGVNGRRKKLLRLLQNPQVHTILVEHKDRLARFGFELLHTSLAATGREIQVLNKGECNDDLVQDMIDVLTSFCGRLYGKRSARNRAKKALETLQQC